MMRRFAKEAGFAVVAAGLMILACAATFIAAFPFGGGLYHAVFAYSSGGAFGSALYGYQVGIGTLTGTLTALLLLRFPVRRWVLSIVATLIGLWFWLGIVLWEPQSPGFHRFALVLLVPIPPILFAPTLAASLYDRRHPRLGETRRSRGALISAALMLIAPYAWLSVYPIGYGAAEIARVRWSAPQWEAVSTDGRSFDFDPDQGVVLPPDQARALLAQCERATPAWVIGTWAPSDQEIEQLEEDLGHYLVQHDTARTRESGFVMPPFSAYYRQYGGLTLLGGRSIIYVNALLPNQTWTEPRGEGVPRWRSGAISVCGGWQAYFGVEYDPSSRMFRGFTYN